MQEVSKKASIVRGQRSLQVRALVEKSTLDGKAVGTKIPLDTSLYYSRITPMQIAMVMFESTVLLSRKILGGIWRLMRKCIISMEKFPIIGPRTWFCVKTILSTLRHSIRGLRGRGSMRVASPVELLERSTKPLVFASAVTRG